MNLNEFLKDPNRELLLRRETLVFEVTERICELMAEQGVTRADLARKLDCSRAAITQALDGSTNMTLGRVVDFFFALGHEASIKTKCIGESSICPAEPRVRFELPRFEAPRIRAQDVQDDDEDDLYRHARRTPPPAAGDFPEQLAA